MNKASKAPLAVSGPRKSGRAEPKGFFLSSHLRLAAVLVDGDFYLKRYRALVGDPIADGAKQVANHMHRMALKHARHEGFQLYRILFYDCVPFNKKVHHPLTGQLIDFGRTDQARFRNDFHDELKKLRKVALRLGSLQDGKRWVIYRTQLKELLKGRIKVGDLEARNVRYEMRQKGVDIKIGTDIASLALKKMVGKIVLVSGDGDFVPAAKLARREGIDFVLDPMWNHIQPSLLEHIDGLRSVVKPPTKG